MKKNIPITKVFFDKEDREMILKPINSGWIVQGPYVEKFQRLFAKFTKSKYAQATSNCTTALHLGLVAMGISRGDKVIVPSFTWVSSANAVEYTGAEVVFCDVNLRTFNIDESKLENLIKKDNKIKGIMAVNLFGLCAKMPKIIAIAKKYNLKVIEDSACGFDSWIGKKHSGTFGDCGCFSFHPRKSITTGEGGMLITNNRYISNLVSQLKDHGANKSDHDRHQQKKGFFLPDFFVRGYNYRMTDIQGALGISQMNKKKFIMNERRRIAKKYDKAFDKIPQLITPYVPKGFKHGYQNYTCIYSDGKKIEKLTKKKIDDLHIKRNMLMDKLESMNIATRQGTHAIHLLSYYKNKYNLKPENFLFSYAADKLSISFPVYAGMSNEDFRYVVSNIKKALK